MFRKKDIDEWALDYWLLQQYARMCFRIYYRKIEIINRHNISLNHPVILAPNHQNALMDAMVLVCNMPYQHVFLARADIFKGKRLIRFLTFMNIMPIYRMRDGIENVKRNDEVFDKTLQVLYNQHNPLCMFAEGNHGDKRRLRPLVKGLFRIALQAQERFGNTPMIKIVPIGFDYGHYQHFRTTLFVNIGKPIEVSEFFEAYRENPVVAINLLKDAFAQALSEQMIDIQTEEYYDLYMSLRGIFNDEMRRIFGIDDNSLAGKFWADKTMISYLDRELTENPSEIAKLDTMVRGYQDSLKRINLRDWVLRKEKYPVMALLLSIVVNVLLLPLFAFGLLNNYLPYWFTATRTNNLKDSQFHSSFKYVIGMIAFPVWYIVLAGILAFLEMPIWFIALYLTALPLAGLASFHYYIHIRKLWARLRYGLLRNKPQVIALRNTRKQVVEKMNEIVKRQKAGYEGAR